MEQNSERGKYEIQGPMHATLDVVLWRALGEYSFWFTIVSFN